ncbi:alpha-N-arabinofuranosidase [Microbacterium halimionae]|uniref:non-reducing end alpha-L-arabinofuranosidase n=1 Tax=Microbacterium halimionae TaxID=1526413 RepID=A0A7W3JLT3_9MICO|nr:alpha-N-arabinofuranosidase [Microbacterium halimionae]MBA8815197.1 alpha-N-arabinofuranosidase [Microbacterium halimionae]NII94012.1 alpha-N-arabinofuranosidase [Microbacterium halimionae]
MTSTTRITVPVSDVGAQISPRLFGTFVEHMGRCVYDGIYEPGHPEADERGFRRDVLALVRELGATVVRYPGGNFVSGYRWEDGVGPRENRPVRLDAAWHSTESNQVGLHEFSEWAADAGLEVMEAVNLGTRGVAEAADLLEYTNHPSGTALSQQRIDNGRAEPFGIRLWCLGNEMDGPWQIGHKTADEYGRLAAETARMMRFIDPEIELVAAGSSNHEMPTFGEWERTVLRHTAGLVDHISVHAYYEEAPGDPASFLASGVGLSRYLDDVAKIIEDVRAEFNIEKPIGISVDEWNVWNQTRWNEVDKPRAFTGDWPVAPRLIEDDYTVTDAVVVGSLLITLLKHAEHVSMANLAQLVNVIAPIRTEPGGPAWRQTTFFPFQLTAAAARGNVIALDVQSPRITTARFGEVDAVDAVATIDGDDVALFFVHRSLDEATTVTVAVPSRLDGLEALVISTPDGADRHAVNGADRQPVGPASLPIAVEIDDAGISHLTLTLPPLAWARVTARLAA